MSTPNTAAPNSEQWEQAATLAELASGPALFRFGRKQIALFQTDRGVFAVDNRCPHEGYPLSRGAVDDDCVLTCNWHNWKFRLADGECLLGGDHVRSYAVEVKGDAVWINVADPPLEETQTKVLAALRTAFDERDFGRICREISRLYFHGIDPTTAVTSAVKWSYDRLEFGYTHAYAASADWLSLYDEIGNANEVDGVAKDKWERQLVCLAEAVDHMSFDALRHQPFAYPEQSVPFDGEEFVAAIEREDRATAEAIAVAATRKQQHWNQLEPYFARAALAHYNDFGHSAIYVYKTRQWLERAGNDAADLSAPLIKALARHLCYTTREDQIPEFSGYAKSLAKLGAPPPHEDAKDVDMPSELEAPFPLGIQQALDWVVTHWGTQPISAIYDALLHGLARNMLQFDTRYGSAYDGPVNQNVGWLNFTHGLTFANAVRALCANQPQLWPQGLLQMACFLGRNRKFVDLELDTTEWEVDDAKRIFADSLESVLDHGMRDPIFSAHLLKTPIAVREEYALATKRTAATMLSALNRFLHSPIKQKHTRRLARQAIDLVSRDF